MNNEIGRKTTSLILMTIMVAGGLTFAIPSMEPVYAQSTPNLYVSAVSEKFDNTFGGLQIIEVVVSDPLITDEGDAAPRVTVDDEDLPMHHAGDGSWYGWFMDKDRDANDDGDVLDIVEGDYDYANKLSEFKQLNFPENRGNTAKIAPEFLYLDLDYGEEIDVVYNKAGNPQTVTLTYDKSKNNSIELDRDFYTPGAEVHVTITDHVLNIDPTSKDVWQFPTIDSTSSTYPWMKVGEAMGRLKLNPETNYVGMYATQLGCDDDCALRIPVGTTENVITFVPSSYTVAENYFTNAVLFIETGPNTGVFELISDRKDANDNPANKIMIKSDAPRNTNTQIIYDQDNVAVNVRLTAATVNLDIEDGTWNSGEKIDLTVVDADQNKDSDAEDDQKVSDPMSRIPTFITGDPHTLMDSKDKSAHTYTQAGSTWQKYPIDPNDRIYVRDLDFRVDDSHRGILSWNGSNNVRDKEPLALAGVHSSFVGGLFTIPLGTLGELRESIHDDHTTRGDFTGRNLFNYDFSVFDTNNIRVDLNIHNSTGDVVYFETLLDNSDSRLSAYDVTSGIRDITGFMVKDRNNETLTYSLSSSEFLSKVGTDAQVTLEIILKDGNAYTTPAFTITEGKEYPIVADFFSYGFYDDGAQAGERVANQIIRVEVEETGDNTSTFTGTLEYIMINQLDMIVTDTLVTGANVTVNGNQLPSYPRTDYIFDSITPIGNEVKFIAFEDITGSDARVNYADIDSNGNMAVVSDQQDIATSSGVVSLNAETYSVGSNVVITLEDADLNTDPDRADTYTVVMDSTNMDPDRDQVGMNVTNVSGIEYESLLPGDKSLGMLLEVTIGGERWKSGCTPSISGLGATGFTLQETGSSTGVFTGSFAIPKDVCMDNKKVGVSGKDIGVTYLDFRDASGQIVTAGDSASIGASTGSVSLDRTVYPVPYGQGTTTGSRALDMAGANLAGGTVKVYVQVNDPDYNLNPTGEDKIEDEDGNGPVKVTISRSGDECLIGHAGGETSIATDEISRLLEDRNTKKASYDADKTNTDKQTAYLLAQLKYDDARSTGGACPVPEPFGALTETSPESGVFEVSFDLSYKIGPSSTDCPATGDSRTCILQGDILTVQYNDTTDASGNPRTVTDSATFDLRNGALQTDKSVYVIGSDMIVTLIDPDLDLDSGTRETYTLDLIKWDSDAGTKNLSEGIFDAEPGSLRETGPSTGIFQVVISVPKAIDNDRLERGEEIKLEYTDYGPSGADYVGDNTEDIDRTVFTSNFGATIELDQSVYSWTDKVFITVTAPDHNLNTNQVDEIGADPYPVRVATRSDDIKNYKLVETGTNTGIFTGEVILTGFSYDADGDDSTGENGKDVTGRTCDRCNGPTDGLLPTDNDDGLEVSFEFSDDETVRKSALIRWNIGEVQWLEASYPATATGVLRVIDPDMNLNPESADNFEVKVWSSSAPSGITLTVTETQPASGIFEGTVFFGLSVQSGGHKLSTEEGDTVTAKYSDNTLPAPYSKGDSEDITATTIIGTIVPPLERVKIESLRIVDSTGTTLSTVSIDQQVQITADLTNTQDKDQPFAYLVQIQDSDGVTVSLSWIDGSLTPSQSFSPSQSWIPTAPGEYTITVFAWESLTIPTALSPQQTTTITVN